jgi:hypothetical protein
MIFQAFHALTTICMIAACIAPVAAQDTEISGGVSFGIGGCIGDCPPRYGAGGPAMAPLGPMDDSGSSFGFEESEPWGFGSPYSGSLGALEPVATPLEDDSDAVAAIAYCPDTQSIGVGSGMDGALAGGDAVDKCMAMAGPVKGHGCCKLITSTIITGANCVSIALETSSQEAFAGGGSSPQNAAGAAKAECSSSCRVLATKCR